MAGGRSFLGLGSREVSCGVLSGACVGSVGVDEASRIDCEIEGEEGRIIDRVRAIGDAMDRMGRAARRSWLGAMTRRAQLYLS